MGDGMGGVGDERDGVGDGMSGVADWRGSVSCMVAEMREVCIQTL